MTKILFKFALTISWMCCSSSGYATISLPDDLVQKSVKSIRHEVSGLENCDHVLSDAAIMSTSKQMQPQLSEQEVDKRTQLVFSNNIGQEIFSHLGRQETGQMLQVNQSINKISKELIFWFNIAKRLQIKIVGRLELANVRDQVKNYYKIDIRELINNTDSRFDDIFNVTANFDASMLVATRLNFQQNCLLMAVIWMNGHDIQYLGLFNEGGSSAVAGTSAHGTIIVGHAYDGQNNNRQTAVIWKKEDIQSFNRYNTFDTDNYFESVLAVSKDGSDFIVRSDKNDMYKVHIPRHDLWNMH